MLFTLKLGLVDKGNADSQQGKWDHNSSGSTHILSQTLTHTVGSSGDGGTYNTQMLSLALCHTHIHSATEMYMKGVYPMCSSFFLLQSIDSGSHSPLRVLDWILPAQDGVKTHIYLFLVICSSKLLT